MRIAVGAGMEDDIAATAGGGLADTGAADRRQGLGSLAAQQAPKMAPAVRRSAAGIVLPADR